MGQRCEDDKDFAISGSVLIGYAGAAGNVVVPEGVSEIGGKAFFDCDSLTSVVIPLGVRKIGTWAFGYCKSLVSVRIPEGVTELGESVFDSCESLVSVSIPEGVPEIGIETFVYCKSLAEVSIPGSVRKIGEGAFYGCTSLREIAFGGTKEQWEAVEKGNEWRRAVPATSVRCKDGIMYLSPFEIRGGVLRSYYGKEALVAIPSSVVEIGEYAFKDCKSPVSITIPNSVTEIDSNAFYFCETLVSVCIPGSVTRIGKDVFSGCLSLREIHYDGTEKQWDAIEKDDGWNEGFVGEHERKIFFEQTPAHG